MTDRPALVAQLKQERSKYSKESDQAALDGECASVVDALESVAVAYDEAVFLVRRIREVDMHEDVKTPKQIAYKGVDDALFGLILRMKRMQAYMGPDEARGFLLGMAAVEHALDVRRGRPDHCEPGTTWHFPSVDQARELRRNIWLDKLKKYDVARASRV